ncbi:MAG TPA: hypothetical protein PKA66_13945 [Gemmatimonadales bacterium]|nr:hypothetical protein [Gemmatimonadales bacterium]
MNVLLAMLVVGAPSALMAQQEETAAEINARAEALAKQAQNPVADMVSLPVQFNWTTGGGLGDETQQITNIQPVLPLAITDDWLLISRTIVPLVNLPGPGGERIKGVADIQEQIFLTPKKSKGVVWGVGPVFSFPTSTNAATETGQFGLGPSVVVLKIGKKWVYGFVANQLWRIAGSSDTDAINSFFVQPFINYNLKRGWAISTAPAITANWDAANGQVWTVPLGLGVSKITRVGKQPMNVLLQYYHNVERPDAAGADLVRMQFTLLYPTVGR